MVMRAAWGPIFSWGSRTGQTFAAVFRRGRDMGLNTYRDQVMRGDWRRATNRGATPSMFRSLPRNEMIPQAWMGESYEKQRRKYRYLIRLQGFSTETGDPVFRTVAYESATQMTTRQVETAAWGVWSEHYEGAPYRFEGLSLVGGRSK